MRVWMDAGDRRWATATLLAGGAAMLLASRGHWNAGELSPGIEGCLTAVVTGFVMGLLHPLRYRQALAICAPAVAAMYALVTYAAGRAIGLGITGVGLVVMGFIGLALAVSEPRPAAAEKRARAAGRRAVATHG